MMSTQKREARIIINRGKRADLKTTIDLYDVTADKINPIGLICGPHRENVDAEIRKLKQQLERSGVTIVGYIER